MVVFIILFLPGNAEVLVIFFLENLRGIICVTWHDPKANRGGRNVKLKLL